MKIIFSVLDEDDFRSDVLDTTFTWSEVVTKIKNALEWQTLHYEDIFANGANYMKDSVLLPFLRNGKYSIEVVDDYHLMIKTAHKYYTFHTVYEP